MDHYRKALRAKQIWLAGGAGIVIVASVVAGTLGKPLAGSGFPAGFVSGFQIGIIAALLAILVVYFVRFAAARHDDAKLEALYAAAADERAQLIARSAGSTGMAVTLYSLAVAAVIASRFNVTVFVTLIAAALFVGLVVLTLKIYFHHRY